MIDDMLLAVGLWHSATLIIIKDSIHDDIDWISHDLHHSFGLYAVFEVDDLFQIYSSPYCSFMHIVENYAVFDVLVLQIEFKAASSAASVGFYG